MAEGDDDNQPNTRSEIHRREAADVRREQVEDLRKQIAVDKDDHIREITDIRKAHTEEMERQEKRLQGESDERDRRSDKLYKMSRAMNRALWIVVLVLIVVIGGMYLGDRGGSMEAKLPGGIEIGMTGEGHDESEEHHEVEEGSEPVHD